VKDPLSKAKSKEPDLLDFYMQKTKERLIESVKNINKVQKKRKQKEQRKKLLECPEYAETYKVIMSKVIDL
jgi:nitrogenase subunit NifH